MVRHSGSLSACMEFVVLTDCKHGLDSIRKGYLCVCVVKRSFVEMLTDTNLGFGFGWQGLVCVEQSKLGRASLLFG